MPSSARTRTAACFAVSVEGEPNGTLLSVVRGKHRVSNSDCAKLEVGSNPHPPKTNYIPTRPNVRYTFFANLHGKTGDIYQTKLTCSCKFMVQILIHSIILLLVGLVNNDNGLQQRLTLLHYSTQFASPNK